MAQIDMAQTLQRVIVFFPVFLLSLCIHEFAHAWVAKLKGDRTAEMMGRLTINPGAHIDPIGTIVMPLIALMSPGLPLFGWAKPVPVNERNFAKPRADMFWVAFAGPLSNIILALIAVAAIFVIVQTGGFEQFGSHAKFAVNFIGTFIQFNLFLAVFNMIPLHPLDGGKVIARFLPESMNRKLEDYQHVSGFILLALAFTGFFAVLAVPVGYLFGALVSLAGA